NAVLRRVSVDGALPTAAGDDDGAVSARTGLTAWAVTELRRLVPGDEVEAAAASLAEPALLGLRVNTCRATMSELSAALAAHGAEPSPGRHHPDTLTIRPAAPTRLPGFAQGWFTVQDEASVLVAVAL